MNDENDRARERAQRAADLRDKILDAAESWLSHLDESKLTPADAIAMLKLAKELDRTRRGAKF